VLQLKKKMLIFLFLQILIVAVMFLYYRELGLTPYINVSFFVGGLFVFIGLIIYVVSNGFFDIFSMSMRKVFTFKRRNLVDAESMRAPSELLDFPYVPFFQLGGSILLCMAIALIIYFV
jgi:membrane-associated HD superfamily phosphohydrolase